MQRQSVMDQMNTTLEIVYIANDGTCTKRKIKICSVTRENVYAYCYLRKQMRTFVKENILAAQKLPSYH